jgi:hypothetical protein
MAAQRELSLWMHGCTDRLNLPMLQPMQPITTTNSLLHPHAGFSPAAGDKGKPAAMSNLNSAAGPTAVVEGHAHHSGTERRGSPHAAERGSVASERVAARRGSKTKADPRASTLIVMTTQEASSSPVMLGPATTPRRRLGRSPPQHTTMSGREGRGARHTYTRSRASG